MNEHDKSLWDFHETQNRQSFALARPRLEFIAKRLFKLKKTGRALDIGIGDGSLLILLNKKYQTYGMDISGLNIKKTQDLFHENNITVELQEGSIDLMPFPDNMFDVITASEVLEHLDNKTLDKALDEIYRVLRDGGTFIGTVPAHEDLNDGVCFCPNCGNTYHRWGHKQSFNEETVNSLFSKKSFQINTLKRLTFFGVQMDTTIFINKIKFIIGKMLFLMLKRIFAPQWWFYFEVVKINK